jgi:hypothetical protein
MSNQSASLRLKTILEMKCISSLLRNNANIRELDFVSSGLLANSLSPLPPALSRRYLLLWCVLCVVSRAVDQERRVTFVVVDSGSKLDVDVIACVSALQRRRERECVCVCMCVLCICMHVDIYVHLFLRSLVSYCLVFYWSCFCHGRLASTHLQIHTLSYTLTHSHTHMRTHILVTSRESNSLTTAPRISPPPPPSLPPSLPFPMLLVIPTCTLSTM